MLLRNLGFKDNLADDTVAILVGPNGSGKSTYLQKICIQYRKELAITVLSNTHSARLNSLRNVNRFSVFRSSKAVIKMAVAKALEHDGPDFFNISAVLEYCRYRPCFGFRLDGYEPYALEAFENEGGILKDLFNSNEEYEDFEIARRFLEFQHSKEVIWISKSMYELSSLRDIVSVLRNERVLIKTKILKRIRVYLHKEDEDVKFEMHHASSGEVSLISSLIFLAATVEPNSIVLIDEPENSLHPSWQREYVSKIVAAMSYRNVSVIIATHSPLVVTGAIMEHPERVSVYQMRDGFPHHLNLRGSEIQNASIESILWNAFEIVTPANHFISEELVEAIDLFEKDEMRKVDVLSLIDRMRRKSFDHKQEEFFKAVVAC